MIYEQKLRAANYLFIKTSNSECHQDTSPVQLANPSNTIVMQALADVLANATDTESHEPPEESITNLQPTPQPAPNPRECFVGEIIIVRTSSTYSTEVVVKDKEDTELRVGFAFPPDGYGYEGVPTEFLKRGLTMLILYPSRTHMDGEGDLIVVHSPKHIKV